MRMCPSHDLAALRRHPLLGSGGAVICAGPDFRGSFQRCTFYACTVYVVHGAAAALSDCAWRACLAALIAHGPATNATLTGCSFQTCRYCVIAEAGASAALHSSELLGTIAAAVIANDPGSHISADDCTLSGTGSQGTNSPCTTNEGTCLRMHGGTARMRRCHVTGFRRATDATGASTSLEVCETSIRCAEACTLAEGAQGALSDVHFRGEGDPDAIAVRLERAPPPGSRGAARLQMTRCDVRSRDGLAVRVGEGSAAALLLCRLRSYYGMVVHGCGSRAVVSHCDARGKEVSCFVNYAGAALRIEGGQLEAVGPACVASGGAEVAAVDVCFRGGMLPGPGVTERDAAVAVEDGARGHFLRCDIPEGYIGMHVNCARARVKDSRVANMSAVASGTAKARQSEHVDQPLVTDAPTAYVCRGGQIDVEGGSVEDCMFGVLTSAAPDGGGAQADLRMHGVVLTGYSRAVQAHEAARAEFVGCRFEGHAGIRAASRAYLAAHGEDHTTLEGGISLCGVQAAAVRGCTFRDNMQDIFVDSDVSVKIEECSFEGPISGDRESCVRVRANAAFEGCHFSRSEVAVISDVPVATCAVRKCTVGAGVKEAFVASGGASVSVVDCEIHATGCGFFAASGGKLVAEDCECSAGSVALLVGQGGGTLHAKRVKAHGGTCAAGACAAGSGDLKLVSCDLSSSWRGVQVAGVQKTASLLHCTVAAQEIGVDVSDGADMTVRETQISQCTTGVHVGEAPCDFEAPCGVCGRSGPEAVQHAWGALLARGVAEGRGARCVHEGAQTHAALDAVQVRDCSVIGVSVTKHGVVTARRLDVAGCLVGFHVQRAALAEKSCFSKCKVAGVPGGVATRGFMCHGPNEHDLAQHEKVQGVEVVAAGSV